MDKTAANQMVLMMSHTADPMARTVEMNAWNTVLTTVQTVLKYETSPLIALVQAALIVSQIGVPTETKNEVTVCQIA